MTVEELAKRIVEYAATHAEQESVFLSPSPVWALNAHSLLNYISEQTGIPQERIGEWCNAAREAEDSEGSETAG